MTPVATPGATSGLVYVTAHECHLCQHGRAVLAASRSSSCPFSATVTA